KLSSCAADEDCGCRRRDYELRIILDRHMGADVGTAGPGLRSSRDWGCICCDHWCRGAQGTCQPVAIGVGHDDLVRHHHPEAWSLKAISALTPDVRMHLLPVAWSAHGSFAPGNGQQAGNPFEH